MKKKETGAVFYYSGKHLCDSISNGDRSSSTPEKTLASVLMEDELDDVEKLITKWDPEFSNYAKITSLFYESPLEAKKYIKAVEDLHRMMKVFIGKSSTSKDLIRSQHLMKIAVKRLVREIREILFAIRDYLDLESVSDYSLSVSTRSSTSNYGEGSGSQDIFEKAEASIKEVESVSERYMSNIRMIVKCMVFIGYGQECIDTYLNVRKSIVEEAIFRLGIERKKFLQIQNIDGEELSTKIKIWLHASNVAVKTLFSEERLLCDQIFPTEFLKESCFTQISEKAAVNLFKFPDSVARCTRSWDKIFDLLELYESTTNLWPDIESIFSYESTSSVRHQVLNSLDKLGDSIRLMLSDFQQDIQKDKCKSTVAGGGIHPLTRYVMNFLAFLSDYSGILSHILDDDSPVQTPGEAKLCEIYLWENSNSMTIRLSWIISILHFNLHVKSGLYENESLAYLFLTNNINYIVRKIRTCNLQYILDDQIVSKFEGKVIQYAMKYQRTTWYKVISSLKMESTSERDIQNAKECAKRFNYTFKETYRSQRKCVVPDTQLRYQIRNSISKEIVPVYQEFYNKHRFRLIQQGLKVLHLSPEDLGIHLSDLFSGEVGSSSL